MLCRKAQLIVCMPSSSPLGSGGWRTALLSSDIDIILLRFNPSSPDAATISVRDSITLLRGVVNRQIPFPRLSPLDKSHRIHVPQLYISYHFRRRPLPQYTDLRPRRSVPSVFAFLTRTLRFVSLPYLSLYSPSYLMIRLLYSSI